MCTSLFKTVTILGSEDRMHMTKALTRTFMTLFLNQPGLERTSSVFRTKVKTRGLTCNHRIWYRSPHPSIGLTSRFSTISSFEPPEPPSFNGQPVFPDVNLKPPNSSSLKLESKERNEDENAVFVVTGASRGIGLNMVKSLVVRTKGTILACCRSPENAHELHNFVHSLPSESSLGNRVNILPLDVEYQETIDKLAETIKNSHGNRVDCLFNVAGILGDGGQTTPGPERSLTKIDRDWFDKTMAVNIIGPMMLSQALAPMMRSKNVRRSATTSGGNSSGDSDRATSVIVNMSARVGSISDNGLGGWYSYRCSKAALNQATRTMAHELKRQGTWTVALHPGTTDTDLSKPFQKNVQESRLFPVDFTVGKLLDVVDSLVDSHSGGFYDWAGKALPF